jgi:hypothetical protein
MTVPIDPTPTTESSAVIAATTIDAIAVQIRAVLATLQTIVPDLQTFDARQIKRVAASAKFGVQSIVPTIAMVTSVPRAQDRNLFDVQAGQLALQFRDQIVPLARQLVKFADDIEYTSDNCWPSPPWRHSRHTGGRSTPPVSRTAPSCTATSLICRAQ